jgi:hypothetical protein
MWIFSLFLHTLKSDIKKPAFDTVVKLWQLVRRRIKPSLTCEPKSRNSKIREYLWARSPDYYSLGLCHKSLNHSAIRYSSKNGLMQADQNGYKITWFGIMLETLEQNYAHFQLWSRHLQGEGLWHKDEGLGPEWGLFDTEMTWARRCLTSPQIMHHSYVEQVVTGPVPSVLVFSNSHHVARMLYYSYINGIFSTYHVENSLNWWCNMMSGGVVEKLISCRPQLYAYLLLQFDLYPLNNLGFFLFLPET